MIYLTSPGVIHRTHVGLHLASRNPETASWLFLIAPLGCAIVGPVTFVKITRKGLALIHTKERLPWRTSYYGIQWMNHRNKDGTYRHSVPLTNLFSGGESIQLLSYDDVMHGNPFRRKEKQS